MATKSKSKSVKKTLKSGAKKVPAKKTAAKSKPVKKVVARPAGKATKSAPKKPAKAKKAVAKPKKAPVKVKKAPAKSKKAVSKPTSVKKVVKSRGKQTAAKPPVKKAVKKAVKKPVAKKAVKKSAAKKPVAKVAAKKKPGKKQGVLPPPRKDLPPVRPLEIKSGRSKKIKPLSAKELEGFRKSLLTLRDQVVDGISFLSGDNLNRSQRDASGDLSGYSLHMADQGTDNYDREFALNLVSSEQDLLYEIDEALRRIDAGTYGICELTGEAIERARLKVIPYARFCVAAQSEVEKGQKRYRPFGPTLSR